MSLRIILLCACLGLVFLDSLAWSFGVVETSTATDTQTQTSESADSQPAVDMAKPTTTFSYKPKFISSDWKLGEVKSTQSDLQISNGEDSTSSVASADSPATSEIVEASRDSNSSISTSVAIERRVLVS